jgi:hypothetical protein
MMFLRLLCYKGEERILRHTVGAINTTIMLRDYIALYTLLLGYMARSLAHSSTGM